MISTPGFREAKDIYGNPYEWDMENARACYRWLSRVVSRSPKQERFRQQLKSLEIHELSVPIKVMLHVLLISNPAARRYISADDLDELDRVKPLRVPLHIRETAHPVPAFERMGIFL